MSPTWESECGQAKLWLGDCLEVMATWPDGAVDAVVTSPPYLDVRDYGGGLGDWGDIVPSAVDVACEKARHVLVNLGLIHRDGKVVRYWDAIFALREPTAWYVWDQGHGLPGSWKNRLAPSHEFVFHFGCGDVFKTVASTKAGQKRVGIGNIRSRDGTTKPLNGNGGFYCDTKVADSVIRVPRWNVQRDEPTGHPAPYPVPFAESLIEPFCHSQAVVADPFMGSGTTGVAALRLGRQFWGAEIDPGYFEIAKKRIQEELGRYALFPEQDIPQQQNLFGG